MVSEGLKILETYGWGALIFTLTVYVLIFYLKNRLKVWKMRDFENLNNSKELIQIQLRNHQVFSNIQYTINNEIPTLKFINSSFPVREKLFRKILEVKLLSVQGLLNDIITMGDFEKMDSAEWSIFVQGKIRESSEFLSDMALHDGIPPIVVSEYMVWESESAKTLIAYVNDLAMSTLYNTNEVRTSTLFYLINLQIITMVGDAERTLVSLNGDLSGLHYGGEVIEEMGMHH